MATDLTLAGLSAQAIRVRGRTYTQPFPEKASQSFLAGQLVGIDSDGRVQLFATAGNSLDSSGINLLGMAVQPATGTTDNFVDVCVFTSDTIITLPVYHATPASAVTSNTILDVAYTLINETTGGAMVDIGTTSNGIILAMRTTKTYDGQKMELGGAYNPVDCKVLSAGRFDQS